MLVCKESLKLGFVHMVREFLIAWVLVRVVPSNSDGVGENSNIPLSNLVGSRSSS